MLVATQEHSSETAVDKTEEGGDDALLTFLQEKNHPVLAMEPLM